jgi:hypothetical protein
MRLNLLLLAVCSGAITGCESSDAKQRPPDPADMILYVNQHIDSQRALKRQLLKVDPPERRVESHLKRDPRVEDARFSILIGMMSGWGSMFATPAYSGFTDCDAMPFAAVVTTRQAMADDDALRLLRDAFSAAGLKASLSPRDIVRAGNTWAVRWSIVRFAEAAENPDLSTLRR